MVFPPRPMADDDYVDGGVIDIIPVGAAAELGATGSSPSWPSHSAWRATTATTRLLRRQHRPAVTGHDRRGGAAAREPRGAAPRGLHADDDRPVVDVVGLFEVQPGLPNRDAATFRNYLSELRSSLPAEMLVRVGHRYSLTGAIATDWGRFCALIDDDQSAERLGEALALVRGTPFEAASSGRNAPYAWCTELTHQIEATVERVSTNSPHRQSSRVTRSSQMPG